MANAVKQTYSALHDGPVLPLGGARHTDAPQPVVMKCVLVFGDQIILSCQTLERWHTCTDRAGYLSLIHISEPTRPY